MNSYLTESKKGIVYTYDGSNGTVDIIFGSGFGYLYNIVVKYPAATVAPTVDITAAGYATYVATEDVAVPAGVKAYIVTSTADNVATLTQIDDIPANTAVILEGNADTYTLTSTTATANVSANLLKASTGVTADGTQYVLAEKSSVVGFYKATTGTIAAGKAYLVIGGGAPEFVGFSFDSETTGVKAIDVAQQSGAVFNLAGQRVAQPTKGLYIQDGKKVIIK